MRRRPRAQPAGPRPGLDDPPLQRRPRPGPAPSRLPIRTLRGGRPPRAKAARLGLAPRLRPRLHPLRARAPPVRYVDRGRLGPARDPARLLRCPRPVRGRSSAPRPDRQCPRATAPRLDHPAGRHGLRRAQSLAPFLRRFPGGESKFVHWSFWPGTVFARRAALDLVDRVDGDGYLREILRDPGSGPPRR